MSKSLLGLVLVFGVTMWAALPSTTVWEVRPTVGSDSANSGCFDSSKAGTDYSQQNAAQYSAADLVLVTATTASSASHSFVAADVGNCLQITAGVGFTAGFYEIVSVAAGVATFDRSAGTGGSTNGTYAVGGALATVADAANNSTANNTIWVKATGNYTVTSALTLNLQNPAGFFINGYTTARGDNGLFTWTTATNSVNLIEFGASSPTGYTFQNINFTNTAGTPLDALHAKGSAANLVTVNNCKFSGFNDGINGDYSVDFDFHFLTVANSSFQSNLHGIVNTGGFGNTIAYSFFTNHSGDAVRIIQTAGSNAAGGPTFIYNSIFFANGGSGINNQGTASAVCAAIACYFRWLIIDSVDSTGNAGDGVTVANGTETLLVMTNSILENNGGWGVNLSTSSAPASYVASHNAYGRNTSGARNGFPAGAGDVAITASPFNSLANHDFSLNSSAAGGLLLKNAGFPGTLTVGGTGFEDIGALRHQDPAAGGGQVGFGFVQ